MAGLVRASRWLSFTGDASGGRGAEAVAIIDAGAREHRVLLQRFMGTAGAAEACYTG